MSPWVLMGHVSDLAHDGDFINFGHLHPGLVVTNFDGELVAWDGRCPHRGALIYRDELFGRRPAPTCGYHGRRVTFQTRPAQLAIVDDWVLATKDKFAKPAALSLPCQMPLVFPSWYTGAPLLMKCDWTVAIENILDYEHVASVHRRTLGRFKMRPQGIPLETTPDGSSMQTFIFEGREWLDGMGLPKIASAAWDYSHTHLFPYSALATTRGWAWSLQNYFPRPDGRTDFITRIYAIPEMTDEAVLSARQLNEATFQEDIEITEWVPKGAYGHLGANENRIAHFRAALAKKSRADFRAALADSV